MFSEFSFDWAEIILSNFGNMCCCSGVGDWGFRVVNELTISISILSLPLVRFFVLGAFATFKLKAQP